MSITNQNTELAHVQELDAETGEIKNSALLQREVSMTQNNFNFLSSMLDEIEDLEPLAFAPKYLKMEVGSSSKGVFLGYNITYIPDEVTKELKPLRTVMWVTKTREIHQHAGVLLLGQFDALNPAPNTPIEIKCIGKKGRALDFSVAVLGKITIPNE